MDNSNTLIITGLQRSGTSLLSKLISNSENCYVEIDPSLPTIFKAVEAVQREISIDESILNFSFHKQIDKRSKRWYADRLDGFEFSKMDKLSIVDSIQEYVTHKLKDKEANILVNKIPDFANRLFEIKQLLPKTKIIYLVRDPRNNAMSIHEKLHRPIALCAQDWKRSIWQAMLFESFFGSENFKFVKYEDILSDPEKTIKEIYRFVGINYFNDSLEIRTAKNENYILPTFDSKKINEYQDKLKKSEILKVEAICSDVMSYFSYERVGDKETHKSLSQIEYLSKEFAFLIRNIFHSKKKHMTNNNLQDVRVPFKNRLSRFIKYTLNLIFSRRIIDAMKNNKKLF